MAYARWSYSDLYIYDDVSMGLVCAICPFVTENDYFIAGEDYALMIEHVKQHRNAGHDVPDGLEEDLEEDSHGRA